MFEHASVAPSNTDTTTGQISRIIPAELILPPPALLWEWLSYIYQTTGEWWRPPVKADANAPKPLNLNDFHVNSRPTPPLKFSHQTAKSKSITRTGFDYRSSR